MKRSAVSVLVVLMLAAFAQAGERENANVGKDRIGIKGYDPVSYFDGKPVAGDEKITAEHDGVIYRFANDANRQKFVAAPLSYAPACGGWCAKAIAIDNKKIDIDPTNYRITNGRLFLFYKGTWGDAVKPWLKDEPGNITKLDSNWKKIVESK